MTTTEIFRAQLAEYLAKHPLTESDLDEFDYPTDEAARRAAAWVFEQMAKAEAKAAKKQRET